MDEIVKIALTYEKLVERIAGRESERKKALSILDEIKAELSEDTIKMFGKAIDYSVAKVYDGVNLELPPNMDIKKLASENHVILVPNHQSHADYVSLSYVMWNEYRLFVYIAGGINLNIFPIGKLFRKSGAFFIRRTFGSDILYKVTLEAYIYALMQKGHPIEFFFEGGRSRTGKLRPPRFGLFQMILSTYAAIDSSKPLLFVPVSISHEVLPEQRSMAREMGGGTKKKEQTKDLLKIFKLFKRKLGTIHIKVNDPIAVTEVKDIKQTTYELAFDCYRAVGKGMVVTPSSLLSLVMLDEPTGAMTWDQILGKSRAIISYCRRYKVPYVCSLDEDNFEKSMSGALDLQITNKKIKTIQSDRLGRTYYAIKDECRMELLYFKNTILHHFLLPSFMFSCWIYVFTGNIKNENDLKKFFQSQRKLFKYEFYLPTLKELYILSQKILADCLKREVPFSEVFTLGQEEVYKIAKVVGGFARSYSYIHEGYYIGAMALRHLKEDQFNLDKFNQVSKEIFELEKQHGRVIKYPESFSTPIINNSLAYYENMNLIEKKSGKYKVINHEGVEETIEKYVNYLTQLLTFNLKLQKVEELYND